MDEKPKWTGVIFAAATMGLTLVYLRGGFDGYTFREGIIAAGGALAACAAFMGFVFLILKIWDWLWAAVKRALRS
jgi:hypothetical protein